MIFENGSIWIPPKKEEKMQNTIGLCHGCGYIKTIVCEGLCGKCLAENLSKSDNSKVVALAEWAIQKPTIARILI